MYRILIIIKVVGFFSLSWTNLKCHHCDSDCQPNFLFKSSLCWAATKEQSKKIKWKKKFLYSVRKSIKIQVDVYKRYFFYSLQFHEFPKSDFVEENYYVMSYIVCFLNKKIWSESGRKYNFDFQGRKKYSDLPFSMWIRKGGG